MIRYQEIIFVVDKPYSDLMLGSTLHTWKPFSCLGNVMRWVGFVHHSQGEFHRIRIKSNNLSGIDSVGAFKLNID